MSLFIGGHRSEIITPQKTSSSVLGFFHRKPSAGPDLIFAGGGDDIVAGGGGNDFAFLGSGDDRFIWNPGDGSDFVDGGSGFDTLEFNGSDAQADTIRLEDKGGLAELNRNFGDVRMTLHRMERVEIATAGGADRIIVGDIAATDVREVAIDLAGAASAGAGDGFNDIVQLHGCAESEVIEVVGEDGSLAVVGLPAFVTIANAEAADQLVVTAGAGDDAISASTLAAGSVQLTLDGGAGADTVFGSAGADKLLGGEGNDVITGGRGDDYALLGHGNDVFVWNPGDGSDVIDGGTAFDEMTFNGSNANESVAISADGAHAIFFRDPGDVTMRTNDVEVHHFNAGGGTDVVFVDDLTGTDVQHVGVELGGDGEADVIAATGSAADEVIQVASGEGEILVSGLSAQVHVFGQDADGRDGLQIDGGAGDDAIDASALAANAVEFIANGGQGDDVLVGGAGDDVLIGGDGDDVLLGGDGDDVLNGGAGDDLLIGGLGDDVIIASAGDDIEVEGFIAGAGSEDRIDVSGLDVDFDWLVANATDSDAGVVLDLGGQHLTLRGVSLSSLHQDDFLV